ncbi:hypothetical protein EJ03DRAFT_89676 [Teratosphaeria nubilosa]|uniref:Uncharacterized protein n=1 Tax=Teratosphaeria nubilosa TaxID=161662 RepID=A0A6G1L9J1_9PEZI|nr:hypothetical protein EJ03DRAFT_89676 [Teratosphaeria nubilosa]
MPPPFTRPRRDIHEAQGSTQIAGNRSSSRPSFRVYEDGILHLPEPSQPQRSHAIPRPPASDWNSRALPLRPSPRPSGTAEHMSFESHQSSTQPALSHQDPLMQSSARIGLPVRAREPPFEAPQSRISLYTSNYGTVAEQERDMVRQPLQELSPSFLNTQLYERSPSSHYHQSSTATAPSVRQSDQARASVISPFFSRSTASYPARTLPASRTLDAGPRHSSPRRSPQMARPNPSYMVPSSRQHHSADQQSHASINFLPSDQRSHVANYQPLFRRPPQRSQALLHANWSSQTHRNEQGLFDRGHILPKEPPPLSRPPATSQRTRVSLAPNMRPASLRNGQEQLLLQIPGVRGGSRPLRSRQQSRAGPLHDEPRSLFSESGGRRSVRR